MSLLELLEEVVSLLDELEADALESLLDQLDALASLALLDQLDALLSYEGVSIVEGVVKLDSDASWCDSMCGAPCASACASKT